ncbi:MAG: hypothetical protein AAB853_02115 [Patescibacteria group bacterium]
MSRSLLRALRNLEIEEKILNIGCFVALVGVFMPWFGGQWFGEAKVWTGFQFYTSFVGLLLFLAHLFTLSLTILPLLGYHLVRPSLRDLLRLVIGLESVFMIIVVLSILTNISFDFSQLEIRFGVYLTLVGSIIVSLYAFLRIQQQRKQQVQELFHHPEEPPRRLQTEREEPVRESPPPPPPSPPPPPPPEDLPLFSP